MDREDRTGISRREFCSYAGNAATALTLSGYSPLSGSGIGLPALGAVRRRRSQDIGASPWCIWASYGPIPGRDTEVELRGWQTGSMDAVELIDELGVKWAHVGINWPEAEPARGRYDFALYDKIVRELKKRAIQPIVQLYASPNAAYGMDGAAPNAVLDNPVHLRAWQGCVQAAVERSRGAAEHFEIWNEPNASPWYWTPKPDPARYAEMVDAVGRAVKAGNPAARVVAGAVAMLPIEFIRGFLRADKSPHWDAFSYHPYGEFPESSIGPIREVSRLLTQARNMSIAMLQTECGYPSTADSGGWQGPGPWGEEIQAKWLLRRLLTDVSAGAVIGTYFMLYDVPSPIEAGPKKGQPSTNAKGLVTLEGRRKKAFRAFQHLTALIDNRYKLSSTEVTFALSAPGPYDRATQATEAWPYFLRSPETRAAFVAWRQGTVKSLEFMRSGGGKLCCYWLPVLLQKDGAEAAAASAVFPEGYFRNPVLIDLLTGSVYGMKTTRYGRGGYQAENLPLRDYPLLIAERAAVPLE